MDYGIVTTVFQPDPTCSASANLWFQSNYRCETYYPPFSPRPTEEVTSLHCPFPVLGQSTVSNTNRNVFACYQNNVYATRLTAYSDCPVGMTGAATETNTIGDRTTIVTRCCPTDYDFTVADGSPTPIPYVIGDTTYPAIYGTDYLCKAASIDAFSGQTVTLTISTAPLSTTEVVWDYERSFIAAEPARIFKTLSVNSEAGTTSTCFNYCPTPSRRSTRTGPVPTSAPFDTYIPPPVAATTQFTPASTCLADSNLWIISANCYLADDISLRSPAWLQCTYTHLGAPDPSDTACYQRARSSTVINNTPSYYAECPAGYTPAHTSVTQPFYSPPYSITEREIVDVYATTLRCCPSAVGTIPVSFTASEVATTVTEHAGGTHAVRIYVVPGCVATRAPEMDGRTVSLGLYSDARIWDKRDLGPLTRRQGDVWGATEAVWVGGRDMLFAEHQRVSWTVFHGTHTCFEGCEDYFTYSYHNTDPNYTPPPRTTEAAEPTGTGGDVDVGATSTSTSTGAAVVARGDVHAGLRVVVVVVTVLQVVAVRALV